MSSANPSMPAPRTVGASWPFTPPEPAPLPPARSRSRVWDLSTNLHCSIVGTCLTAGELRQLLAKLGHADARSATAHSIHHRGVTAAGQSDLAGKLLNKLLDRKHATAIKRFARARSEAEVAVLWREAMNGGDVPGAYWATLSHPLTGEELVREAFGDVHMLSHLVGSASRLDIARLRRLEEQLADRDETIARQQARLRRAAEELAARSRKIGALETQPGRSSQPVTAASEPARTVPERRLQLAEERLAQTVETLRLLEARMRASTERGDALERENAALRREIEACENLAAPPAEGERAPADLGGSRILYVGGRTGHIDRLRGLTGRFGGTFASHDGGVEESASLLPGLVASADVVFFPVDCVSHGAAERVKRHCRDANKPFVPLRSAGIATFATALGRLLDRPPENVAAS